MKELIEISEQEIKDLKEIRNYFGEHDKTQFEHLAFAVLDSLIRKIKPIESIQSKGKTKEEVFFEQAHKLMNEFNHNEFPKSFPTLFKTILSAMEEYAQSHLTGPQEKTKEELKEKFLKMFDDFHETYNKDEIFDWFWNNLRESHSNKDGWVSCAERLPEPLERVLVYATDVALLCFGVAFYNGKYFQFDATMINRSTHFEKVSDKRILPNHWMPLPKPPQL